MENRIMKETIQTTFIILVFMAGCAPGLWAADFPALNETCHSARAKAEGNVLTISTGTIQRRWRLTDNGPVTIGLKNLETGHEWIEKAPAAGCDFVPAGFSGTLTCTSLTAAPDDDEGFTDEHLAVRAEFRDPESGSEFRWVIWAYPDACGLRTRLSVRKLSKAEASDTVVREGVVDSLPVAVGGKRLYAWTPTKQAAHIESAGMSGEETEHVGLEIRDGDQALVLIKESVKGEDTKDPCGYANTGRFAWDETALRNTGTGWLPEQMTGDDWKACWASWTLVASGSADDVSLAVMRFDRRRFPKRAERDLHIGANTWDPLYRNQDEDVKNPCRENRHQAREQWVLREIDSMVDLGVEALVIDDGWQTTNAEQVNPGKTWRPQKTIDVKPGDSLYEKYPEGVAPNYPDGWTHVRSYAKEKGVKLGLWFSHNADADNIVWNVKELGAFKIKYDFYVTATMALTQRHLEKIRTVSLSANWPFKVEWDTTTQRRIGFYHGREYGPIYPRNLNMRWPSAKYNQRHVFGLASSYGSNRFNIQNLILPIGNPKVAGQEEARQYSEEYCFALAMNASPIFFMGTQYVEGEESRNAFRKMINIYKQHREALFEGYVFPLDGVTGLQNYNPETGVNYLTVFREHDDNQKTKTIKLRFAKPNAKLQVTDLMTGKTDEVTLDGDCNFQWTIETRPDFAFLKVYAENNDKPGKQNP